MTQSVDHRSWVPVAFSYLICDQTTGTIKTRLHGLCISGVGLPDTPLPWIMEISLEKQERDSAFCESVQLGASMPLCLRSRTHSMNNKNKTTLSTVQRSWESRCASTFAYGHVPGTARTTYHRLWIRAAGCLDAPLPPSADTFVEKQERDDTVRGTAEPDARVPQYIPPRKHA